MPSSADGNPPAIMDAFAAEEVPSDAMDLLWADGWRHFGEYFFRYSQSSHEGIDCRVIPMRIDLQRFVPSSSQRRILRRAEKTLRIRIGPAHITPEHAALFEIHKRRFTKNIPESIHDVLSAEPDRIPCRCLGVDLLDGERLMAASFLDIGTTAASSIYGVFHPSAAKFSPGILTMLIEIDEARRSGLRYYYHGYRYNIPSHYDYKRRFAAVEEFDWCGRWIPAGLTSGESA